MMKLSRLGLRNNFIFLILVLFIMSIPCNNIYSTSIYNFDHANITNGPMVLKDNNLVVTGDSFAGKFCEFENNRDLKLVPYAIAGQTIDQNKIIMALALNFEEKNVLFSIGVNDMFAGTMPYMFESVLRELLKIAAFNGKRVIMHSYLMFFSDNYYEMKFDAYTYDSIIKKLCAEYPNNTLYIDVHDLERIEYVSEDMMHYNKLFYDELYRRVFKELYQLEN